MGPELLSLDAFLGFIAPTAIYGSLLLLHMLLPAWTVDGYVKSGNDESPLLRYRLNGLAVFLILIAVWWFELTGLPREWLWHVKWYSIAGAVLLSVLVTSWLVFRRPPEGSEDAAPRGFMKWSATWLVGRELSARVGARTDVKMFLYLAGGAVLALNALSGAAYHIEVTGDESNIGVMAYAAMWTFFVVDYFCFERVQLYTFDLIHEKVGFRAIFGCLVVYPYLYLAPLWGLASVPAPDMSLFAQVIVLYVCLVLFFAGWICSRGANLQKYWFKRWPDRIFLRLIRPRTIGDGPRKILVSGFWSLSRHMNYFGEWLIAVAMALSFGHFANPWSWVYVVIVVLIFVQRQRLDDEHCAEKYGDLWDQYREQTRYRIIPWVY